MLNAIFDPNLIHLCKLVASLGIIPFGMVVGAGFLFGVQFSLFRLILLCGAGAIPTLFFGYAAGFLITNLLLVFFLRDISNSDSWLDVLLVILVANIATAVFYSRMFNLPMIGSSYLTGSEATAASGFVYDKIRIG